MFLYYSEESDESDEMKLVPDKKPKDHSVKLPPIKPKEAFVPDKNSVIPLFTR
jgi:hypothetical protein